MKPKDIPLIIVTIIVTFFFTGSYYVYKNSKQKSFEVKKHDIELQLATEELNQFLQKSYYEIFTEDGFLNQKITKEYKSDVDKNTNENTTDDNKKMYEITFIDKLLTTGVLDYNDVSFFIEEKKLIMSNNHLATTNILQNLLHLLQKNNEMVYLVEKNKQIKRLQVPMWYVLNSTPSANLYGKFERKQASLTLNYLKYDTALDYAEKYNKTTKIANFVNREWGIDEGGRDKTEKWFLECKNRGMICEIRQGEIFVNSNVFIIVDYKYNVLHIFYQKSFKTNAGLSNDQSTFKYYYNNYDLKSKKWFFKNQFYLNDVLRFIEINSQEYKN